MSHWFFLVLLSPDLPCIQCVEAVSSEESPELWDLLNLCDFDLQRTHYRARLLGKTPESPNFLSEQWLISTRAQTQFTLHRRWGGGRTAILENFLYGCQCQRHQQVVNMCDQTPNICGHSLLELYEFSRKYVDLEKTGLLLQHCLQSSLF